MLYCPCNRQWDVLLDLVHSQQWIPPTTICKGPPPPHFFTGDIVNRPIQTLKVNVTILSCAILCVLINNALFTFKRLVRKADEKLPAIFSSAAKFECKSVPDWSKIFIGPIKVSVHHPLGVQQVPVSGFIQLKGVRVILCLSWKNRGQGSNSEHLQMFYKLLFFQN